MLDAIGKHLEGYMEAAEKEGKEGFQWVQIDGHVQNEKRQSLIDKFQADPKVRFAVLSITVAGIGITLTAASTVVFCE